MTECLKQDMNFAEYPLWFQNSRLAASTIMVTPGGADKTFFTGAVTTLRKQQCIGCPKTE
ncbi:MAG: hypothetical protein JRJ79_04120 [Deltaproteobacteria bacterium]|nr:hypothetical protein [Deltaproteobacteria bacterium]